VSDNFAGHEDSARAWPDDTSRVARLLPPLVLLAGFIARLLPAKQYFLNPDEALHYLAASQSSLQLAYRAALTNAHPPLLILVLYYWRALGHTEFILRLPSVFAGTACCWLLFLWLSEIAGRSVAFIGLLLAAFAPSLIALSSEVRQYALLLFFIAACFYLSERALKNNSSLFMISFSASLCGAILTHYSSLLFATVIGVYMLARLLRQKNFRLLVLWALGQIAALALILYFMLTHVRQLKAAGMPHEIAETWLRKSVFHPSERNLFGFAFAQTVRVFTYLFSHGIVGAFIMLAFLLGLIVLLRARRPLLAVFQSQARQPFQGTGPTPRELALLLIFPFVLNCAVSLAGLYPYGGTRHNSWLAPFVITGAALGIATFFAHQLSIRSLAIIALLAWCNLFPAPPPLIKNKNHSRALMTKAVGYLKQHASPASIVLADYQSALLLGYYGCDHPVAQLFPPLQDFAKFDCGPYQVISAKPGEWRFNAKDLPAELVTVAETYGLTQQNQLWMFDAGWINDLAPELSRAGECQQPKFFGENILICQLRITETQSPKPAQK
jgi:hypothetical protein